MTWRQGGEEIWRIITPAGVKDSLGLVLSNARAANPTSRMLVKMDKDAQFGVMSDMMGAFQQANAPRFNVQTNLAMGGGAFSRERHPGRGGEMSRVSQRWR